MCAQSCLTLCDPRDCSSPGSSVHGILQARTLEWAATFSSRDLPNPGTEATSLGLSALAGRLPLHHLGAQSSMLYNNCYNLSPSPVGGVPGRLR